MDSRDTSPPTFEQNLKGLLVTAVVIDSWTLLQGPIAIDSVSKINN